MRLHYIQHVEFEFPANIEVWAKDRGWDVTGTLMFKGDEFPAPDKFDLLVVLGGPMGVYDEDEFNWLVDEKRFIEKCIASGKRVLGVCLGAQLIADVLGARVYKNRFKEIGWFDVRLKNSAFEIEAFKGFPESFTAFHWHGDTFDIPDGCRWLAESDGCKNQAFEYDNGRVIALQFHLETSVESVKKLAENSADEINGGRYVQTPDEMLRDENRFYELKKLLYLFMDNYSSFQK